MNRLTIIGNLTKEPESRMVNSGTSAISVCTFTVAVDRRGSKDASTDYFRVTAWRKLGENCGKWLHKGKKVAVSGPVTASAYQAADGTARASLEVTADDVEFLSPANEQGYDSSPRQQDGYTVVDEDPPF